MRLSRLDVRAITLLRAITVLAAACGALAVVATGVAGAAGTSGSARAALNDECTGVQVCVPVKGPWVKIPAGQRGRILPTEWELKCAGRNDTIGGTDAIGSTSTVAVTFQASPGSPVRSGVSTHNAVIFSGLDGGGGTSAVTYRPAIGCIPGGGGSGTRSRVSYQATFPPFTGLDIRSGDTAIEAGQPLRVADGCQIGGRLLHASSALGFFGAKPPSAALLRSISSHEEFTRDSFTVTVTPGPTLPRDARVVLQVRIICTEGFH